MIKKNEITRKILIVQETAYGSLESGDCGIWSIHRKRPDRVATNDVVTPNI